MRKLVVFLLCLACEAFANISQMPSINDPDVDDALALRLKNAIFFPNYTVAFGNADAASSEQAEAFKYKADLAERIVCTKVMICSASDRLQWRQRVTEAKSLRDAFQLHNTSHSSSSLLCSDTLSAAFLLEEGSEDWPMACLWTGSNGNATCAPAPFSENAIFYLQPKEWGEKLATFRAEIGCRQADVQAAQRVAELYVCRQRCTESGVGYLPSILMAASILVVLALLLGEQ